ncbi:MAG: GntR family transcriptional regulator [Lentisphaeria bacterium]
MSTGSVTSPVYQPLIERIRKLMLDGKAVPGTLVGTERAMTRETGLSRKSVRLAVDQLIDDGLVERRPGIGIFTRAAHTFTRQIQLVVPTLAVKQSIQLLCGALAVAGQRGVQVQIYEMHGVSDADMQFIRALPTTAADGAIIQSAHHEKLADALFHLKAAGYPFVLVDEEFAGGGIPCVLADNYGGGYSVGKALAALGHRRIGFLGGVRASDTVRARLDGLRDAVLDAGRHFDRSLVADITGQPGEEFHHAIHRLTGELMSAPNPPTALFCSNDIEAASACRELRRLGRRIPGDLSVVGFDDDPVCEFLDPVLSSVRQPTLEMGQTAMKLLLELLAPKGAGKGKKAPVLHLPTVWLPRDSIAPPPPRSA